MLLMLLKAVLRVGEVSELSLKVTSVLFQEKVCIFKLSTFSGCPT